MDVVTALRPHPTSAWVQALRAEGLDPDDSAVMAAIGLVRWELSLLSGLQRQKVTIASRCADASAAVASYDNSLFPGAPRRSEPVPAL